MDIEKIKELLKLVEDSSLTEFQLKEGEDELVLKKEIQKSTISVKETVSADDNKKQVEDESESLSDQEYILSPMVGTFYNSPAPDASTFVNVGDVIKKGQPLCIIEAMKLMNEINSDYDAEIVAVMVSNEQKVEYGQPLFKIKRI